MANSVGSLESKSKGFGATQRSDLWWLQPAATFAALGLFVVYATVAAFLAPGPVTWSPNEAASSALDSHTYLSPFYSPAWLFSLGNSIGFPYPVFAILWIPLGFRMTCYFARRTYYRGIMGDPAACAVAEFASRNYKGESKFPFILQNLHRYFLYFAIMLVVFHWFDIFHAFRSVDAAGNHEFYIGIGSIVLFADALFLTLYVFSCHSIRHLLGGGSKCFTCKDGTEKATHKTWGLVTKLNAYHGLFFWLSLFAVGFADFYVRVLVGHLE